jgi:hypothetical protein
MNPRISNIPENLKPLRQALAEAKIRLAHAERDLEGRKVYLIPADGWPGSNDGQRKAAAEKTYLADEVLITLRNQIEDATVDMLRCQALIDGLEDERRAAEWMIRERMVEGLLEQGIPQEYTEPVDDLQTVLDDVPF